MATVIVVTNFSVSSRNALEYTCRFLHNPTTRVILLNIFSFPGALSGDAIAIAAMSETIANDERSLKKEYEWVKENYPQINIEPQILTGVFLEVLRNKIQEESAKLVVMGASGSYNDLLSWDVNIIDSFVDLQTPVLVIPASSKYKPIQKMAFAVNYYRKNLQMPVSMIKRLIQFTNAKLYVINVVAPTEIINEEAKANKGLLQESLSDLSPFYYEPAFSNIFTAIDNFTAEENINMLIVIPTRHGIWQNIFQQTHKGLVYLNHIPVLSLRQGATFL
jgi:hypothetical protein